MQKLLCANPYIKRSRGDHTSSFRGVATIKDWGNLVKNLEKNHPKGSHFWALQQIIKHSNVFHFSSVAKPEDKGGSAFDTKELLATPVTSAQIFEAYASANAETHLRSVSHWNESIITALQMTSPIVQRGYGILDVGKVTLPTEEQKYLSLLPTLTPAECAMSEEVKAYLFEKKHQGKFIATQKSIYRSFETKLLEACRRLARETKDPFMQRFHIRDSPEREIDALLCSTAEAFVDLPQDYYLVSKPLLGYVIQDTDHYLVSIPDYTTVYRKDDEDLHIVNLGFEAKSITGSTAQWQSIGHALLASLLNHTYNVNKPIFVVKMRGVSISVQVSYFSPQYLDSWKSATNILPKNQAKTVTFQVSNTFGSNLLIQDERETAIKLLKRVSQLSVMTNSELAKECPELMKLLE